MKNYTRDYSFADNKTSAEVPSKLDIEFDAISNAFKTLYETIAKTINDDGTLKPGVVDGKAISKSVVLLPEETSAWAEGQSYKVGSIIFHESSLRWCGKAHKSVSFKDEQENWHTVIDFKPLIEKVTALAHSPHVVRVEKNLDAVQDLAKAIAPLMELRAQIDVVLRVGEALPLLKSLGESGEDTIHEIHENLNSLVELASISDKLNILFEVSQNIRLLSGITQDLSKIADIADDIKTVSKFAKQIKAMSAGMGGIQEEKDE